MYTPYYRYVDLSLLLGRLSRALFAPQSYSSLFYRRCLLTAPPGLDEVVDFAAYIEGKFGAEYVPAEVGRYVEAVRACILRECNEEQQNSDAELLHAAMLELKAKNRWKKSAV
jgi:hypothetical protein